MYNQPENEPEIIYAIVEHIRGESKSYLHYFFDEKKAKNRLLQIILESPDVVSDFGEDVFSIQEIKVEK